MIGAHEKVAQIQTHLGQLNPSNCPLTSGETEAILRQLNGIVRVLYEATKRAEATTY